MQLRAIGTAVAVVTLAFQVPAQRTIVVDAAGGAGSQYKQISAAVAAAKAGDRILCRKGTYSEFDVSKGVTILGEDGATIHVQRQTPIRITKIAASEQFALANFTITRTKLLRPAPREVVLIENCAGAVRLESVSSDVHSNQLGFQMYQTARIDNCRAVSITSSLFSPGIWIRSSTVSFSDSTLRGSGPGFFLPTLGLSTLRSRVDLSRTNVVGGSAIGHTTAFPAVTVNTGHLTCRGDARHTLQGGKFYIQQFPAIQGRGLSTLTLDPRVRLVGNVQGFTKVDRREVPSLSVGASALGATSSIEVVSKAKDLVAVWFSAPSTPRSFGPIGDLWLEYSPFVLLAAGVCDTKTGRFGFVLQHGTDPRLRGLQLGYQGVRIRGLSLELSNPVLQTLR